MGKEKLKHFDISTIMDIKDIKHITNEDINREKTKEEYDELLLKVYWLLRGMNIDKQNDAIDEMIMEVEEFIWVER